MYSLPGGAQLDGTSRPRVGREEDAIVDHLAVVVDEEAVDEEEVARLPAVGHVLPVAAPPLKQRTRDLRLRPVETRA